MARLQHWTATAALAGAAALISASAAIGEPAPAPPGGEPLIVSLKDAKGVTVGKASLVEGPGAVVVRLSLKGVAPGWHGLHFHAVGDCSDPKFEKAGAHINHTAQDGGTKAAHGLLNPNGPDYGDLPNIHVGADGTAQAEVSTRLVSLNGGDGGRPSLRDSDGSALMLHVNADDHFSQPIGGAGARLACAVIR